MALHFWLEKKYPFYKKWHKKPYAEAVHYAILFAAIGFNLVLLYKLQMLIKTI